MRDRRGELLEKLESAFDDVHRPIRQGFGLARPAFDHLLATLDEFREEWKTERVIPKIAASLFLAAYPALHAASHSYSGEKARAIADAADALFDAIDRAIALDQGES